MEKITRKAYAKINLGLDVLRRRENGYHDLRMIMQTVDLYDVITMEKTKEEGIRLTSNVPGLACDESNLICKVAKLMTETCSLSDGFIFHLEKNIPMAAGMAGGSTDAAAVFHGINELCDLKLSKEELCGLGVKIGADVPYCIMGGTYLAEGIGEILTPLPSFPETPMVVLKPAFDVSTRYVYENLHANELKEHPDIDGQIRALKEGDVHLLAELMGNVLQNVTIEKYPQIREIKERMLQLGSFGSMMSGSGPSVFGLFDTAEKAGEAAKILAGEYPDAFVCATRSISEI